MRFLFCQTGAARFRPTDAVVLASTRTEITHTPTQTQAAGAPAVPEPTTSANPVQAPGNVTLPEIQNLAASKGLSQTQIVQMTNAIEKIYQLPDGKLLADNILANLKTILGNAGLRDKFLAAVEKGGLTNREPALNLLHRLSGKIIEKTDELLRIITSSTMLNAYEADGLEGLKGETNTTASVIIELDESAKNTGVPRGAITDTVGLTENSSFNETQRETFIRSMREKHNLTHEQADTLFTMGQNIVKKKIAEIRSNPNATPAEKLWVDNAEKAAAANARVFAKMGFTKAAAAAQSIVDAAVARDKAAMEKLEGRLKAGVENISLDDFLRQWEENFSADVEMIEDIIKAQQTKEEQEANLEEAREADKELDERIEQNNFFNWLLGIMDYIQASARSSSLFGNN